MQIKFMSLGKGKMHPVRQQDDGTFKSLCGKTLIKPTDEQHTWMIIKNDGEFPKISSQTATWFGDPCGFKTCKDFLNSVTPLQSNPQNLALMEA